MSVKCISPNHIQNSINDCPIKSWNINEKKFTLYFKHREFQIVTENPLAQFPIIIPSQNISGIPLELNRRRLTVIKEFFRNTYLSHPPDSTIYKISQRGVGGMHDPDENTEKVEDVDPPIENSEVALQVSAALENQLGYEHSDKIVATFNLSQAFVGAIEQVLVFQATTLKEVHIAWEKHNAQLLEKQKTEHDLLIKKAGESISFDDPVKGLKQMELLQKFAELFQKTSEDQIGNTSKDIDNLFALKKQTLQAGQDSLTAGIDTAMKIKFGIIQSQIMVEEKKVEFLKKHQEFEEKKQELELQKEETQSKIALQQKEGKFRLKIAEIDADKNKEIAIKQAEISKIKEEMQKTQKENEYKLKKMEIKAQQKSIEHKTNLDSKALAGKLLERAQDLFKIQVETAQKMLTQPNFRGKYELMLTPPVLEKNLTVKEGTVLIKTTDKKSGLFS